jgi:hypothetical protein
MVVLRRIAKLTPHAASRSLSEIYLQQSAEKEYAPVFLPKGVLLS